MKPSSQATVCSQISRIRFSSSSFHTCPLAGLIAKSHLTRLILWLSICAYRRSRTCSRCSVRVREWHPRSRFSKEALCIAHPSILNIIDTIWWAQPRRKFAISSFLWVMWRRARLNCGNRTHWASRFTIYFQVSRALLRVEIKGRLRREKFRQSRASGAVAQTLILLRVLEEWNQRRRDMYSIMSISRIKLNSKRMAANFHSSSKNSLVIIIPPLAIWTWFKFSCQIGKA